MTTSLMARLFAVPMMIIAVIVACAIVVVLMFGSITTDKEQPISSLLDVLEANVGEKTMGVLLPREKQVWQVARELSLRLDNRGTELTQDELALVTERLAALLGRMAEESDQLSEMGQKQMHLVMRALAKTEQVAAIEPIAACLGDGLAETRREALFSLAALKDVPGIGAITPKITNLLDDSDPVVRLLSCVTISIVGAADDPEVMKALRRAYFDEDREVRWNATLALARLGSSEGKSLLLDMLSREFWEKDVKVRSEIRPGEFREYPMPPQAVSGYLVAAVEASADLDDTEIRESIRLLENDSAPAVKSAALQASSSATGGV